MFRALVFALMLFGAAFSSAQSPEPQPTHQKRREKMLKKMHEKFERQQKQNAKPKKPNVKSGHRRDEKNKPATPRPDDQEK